MIWKQGAHNLDPECSHLELGQIPSFGRVMKLFSEYTFVLAIKHLLTLLLIIVIFEKYGQKK